MTTKTTTNTTLEEALDRAQKRARTRTLDVSDVEEMICLYGEARAALAAAGLDGGATVLVEGHGGAVPNGYRGCAEATWAKVQGGGVSVTRGRAEQRPRGECWDIRVTVSWPDGRPDERPTLRGTPARALNSHTLAWWL